MTVQEIINIGKVTKVDILNFVDGVGCYGEVQKTLNEATGFEKAGIDINTDEATNEEILSAGIIDVTPF